MILLRNSVFYWNVITCFIRIKNNKNKWNHLMNLIKLLTSVFDALSIIFMMELLTSTICTLAHAFRPQNRMTIRTAYARHPGCYNWNERKTKLRKSYFETLCFLLWTHESWCILKFSMQMHVPLLQNESRVPQLSSVWHSAFKEAPETFFLNCM